MINIAFVEDDLNFLELFNSFCDEYAANNKLDFNYHHFGNAEVFLEKCKTTAFDLVFMDIELPGLNGMETSKKLRQMDSKVVIVFVTNMASFAIEGYQVNAFDFILKPLVKQTFFMKMDRIVEKIKSEEDCFISLSYAHQQKLININELVIVDVRDHYIEFVLKHETVRFRGSLKNYEEQLYAFGFLKCNNHSLVNPRFIIRVDKDMLIMRDYQTEITRNKKKQFLESFALYLGKH